MKNLDHFLFGYFTVQGDKTPDGRILALLLENGVGAKKSAGRQITVKQKYRAKAQQLLSKTDAVFSENKGLPAFLYRNRKRYGVFVALLLCFACYIFVSGRIWDIRISGVAEKEEASVLSALEKEGVCIGASFRSIELSKAETGLLYSCPDIGWVNLNRRGTVLYAELLPAKEHAPDPKRVVGNIVAAEDAVVEALSPTSGASSVKVGDAVKKGMLLISAVQKDGTISGAGGEVLGRVSGSIVAEARYTEGRTAIQRERKCEIRLKVLNFSINIFKNYRNLPADCDIIENESRVRLFGKYALPISVCTKTAYRKEERSVKNTDAEVVALASSRLGAALSELYSLGALESLRTVGEWTDEGYVMRAYYEQVRSIGKWEPIATEEKG